MLTSTVQPLLTVPVSDYQTSIRRHGSGPPLLFLHGAFFPTQWLPLHDELSRSTDLIVPLHPGYAEGAAPDWLRGFDDLVIHYHDLLDQLKLSAVHVVGYDLGGWLAAEFASYYPERVTSLTLIASTGLRLADAPSFEFLAADPNRVVEALFNGSPAEHATELPDPGDIAGFVDAYGVNGVTARLIWERRYNTRLDRRVGRLRMPSLVITPEEDRIVPIAHAERWAELLSAKLVRIPSSGHACIVEQPHAIARAITALVGEAES